MKYGVITYIHRDGHFGSGARYSVPEFNCAMEALAVTGAALKAAGGFGSIDKIQCNDLETGVTQWEITIL